MNSVALIGFGQIGSRMGRRLAEHNYKVYVYDVSDKAMNQATNLGLITVSSPAEAAANSDYIITCVTDEKSVEDVILGCDGLIEGINSNSIIIEMTTSKPETTKKVAKHIEEKGGSIIDAPVSRGVPAAENGTLSILVGGDERVLEKCKPILDVLGTDIIHVGDIGAGHTVKAINMMMMTGNLLAATEILMLGMKEELDLNKMLEVINASSGESYITSHHFPKYVLNNSFNSNFTIELMRKDLNISLDIADDLKLVPFMGRRAGEIYDSLIFKGKKDEDNMSVVKLWMEKLEVSYAGK